MAGSGWNEAALLTMYHQGLNSEILTEMACRDDDLTLDQLITLSICLDQLLNNRDKCKMKQNNRVATRTWTVCDPIENKEVDEPMQCDSSCLSKEERLCPLTRGICLCCGGDGHLLCDCRAHPHKTLLPTHGKHVESTPLTNVPTKGLVSKSFLLPVIFGCHQVSLVVSALTDFGAEGNFIHSHLVE